MKSIQNMSAYFFIFAVAILSVISVMGVWDVFSDDVIWKSFKTLGLLAVVAVITMTASKHIGNSSNTGVEVEEMVNPVWVEIRKATVVILVVSVSLLALLGVLSIWEVIQDKDIQYKSLTSLTILAFGAFIIILTCRSREVVSKKSSDPVTTFTVTKEEVK